MQSAPLHSKEQERLATLLRYEILDTDAEKSLDELTALAQHICGTKISLVSLVDLDRQWFKSKQGLDATQTTRSIAFCSHAILQNDVFEIPNTLKDSRFFDNPLVTHAPNIRFYAGAPLVAPNGLPIGTLCVIDDKPMQLTNNQREALSILSRQVVGQMELRLRARQLERVNKDKERFFALLAHDLRAPFNSILGFSKTLATQAKELTPTRIVQSAHGILNSSLRAFSLLEELLEWSQLNLNENAYPCAATQLNPLIDNCLEFFAEVIALKNIAVDIDIPVQTHVFANDVMVKTVLRNLLSNAIKFTAINGAIALTTQPNNGFIEIAVANCSEALDPQIIDNLFKAIVPSSLGSQGEKGTGMGLLLCSQFVEQQGGRMWLDQSTQGIIKVCFSLPAVS